MEIETVVIPVDHIGERSFVWTVNSEKMMLQCRQMAMACTVAVDRAPLAGMITGMALIRMVLTRMVLTRMALRRMVFTRMVGLGMVLTRMVLRRVHPVVPVFTAVTFRMDNRNFTDPPKEEKTHYEIP